MKVNVEKCAVLRFTCSLSPILYDYTLASHYIAIKRLHTYLGVGIDSNMTWSSHIQTISNKSTKVLNFIKRNLYNCPPDTKRTAYLTLVRPIMEYAAPVEDPYYNVDIYKLEKVQRRATRWILSDYSRTTVQTSHNLKRHTGVLSCERVRFRVPHVSTHVYFHSNIIIINLQPLSINFMFAYSFCQSSAHSERC